MAYVNPLTTNNKYSSFEKLSEENHASRDSDSDSETDAAERQLNLENEQSPVLGPVLDDREMAELNLPEPKNEGTNDLEARMRETTTLQQPKIKQTTLEKGYMLLGKSRAYLPSGAQSAWQRFL